jgi:hypothetical protein
VQPRSPARGRKNLPLLTLLQLKVSERVLHFGPEKSVTGLRVIDNCKQYLNAEATRHEAKSTENFQATISRSFVNFNSGLRASVGTIVKRL